MHASSQLSLQRKDSATHSREHTARQVIPYDTQGLGFHKVLTSVLVRPRLNMPIMCSLF